MTTDLFTNLTAPGLFSLTNADQAAGLPSGSLAQLNALLTPAGQAAAAGTVTTIYGNTVTAEIVGLTPHDWVAGADGLYHTATNLAAEWQTLYNEALAGVQLTSIQHLEANAQAAFLNTSLNTLSAATQERDREDFQREADAISVAMDRLGLSGVMQLTTNDYLAIEKTLQSDPLLLELGMQGHGLNSPPDAKYDGYTNDFQNNVDRTTLFIGNGSDTNQNALTDFFDDQMMTHLVYPSVPEWSNIEQLNQNGANEDDIVTSTSELNDTMFNYIYTSADFSQTPGTASDALTPVPASDPVAGAGQFIGYWNIPVDTTVTISNADLGAGITDVWTTDSNGLYQLASASGLAAAWQSDYTIMLSGTAAQQASLTSIQRLEGNIEAIFLNTGLATLSAAQQLVDREDIQRQLDAMSAAMTAAGIGPQDALTGTSYVTAEHALQDNADWEELAIQGHGVFGTGLTRYNGYTADMEYAWNSDQATLYTGGGFDTGTRAVGNLLNDLLLMAFPVAAQNGELKQFDQGGSAGHTLAQTVDGLNATMLTQVLTAADFSVPGSAAGASGTETTVYGQIISGTMIIGNALLGTTDVWTVNAIGQFVTTTDLATEWQSYYSTMLSGHGDSLTAVQRLMGNAEAVLEATGLSASSSAATYRMDVQRVIDAESQAMTALGLGGSALSAANYLALQAYIQSSPALEELSMQGQGLDSPPSAKYNGFVNDFKYKGFNGYSYVGGGLDSGKQAYSFFSDSIIGYLTNPTYVSGSTTYQQDENAYTVGDLNTMLTALNNTLFSRVYVAADFNTNPWTSGPVVTIPGANTTPNAAPVAGAGQVVTETGAIISATITGLAHTWTVDANGLFQTTTDLALEWYNNYQQALISTAGMNWLQRAEANSEAIFLNSNLAQGSEVWQAQWRADIQRDLDATWSAMQTAGLAGATSFTQQNYLSLQQALDGNATLVELASQGLGLAGNWSGNYSGYNGNFRGNAQTVFIGPGYDNGLNAVSHLLSDMIGGDLVFGSTVYGGRPYTPGQSGSLNLTLAAAVQDFNLTCTTVLTASNFAIPGAQPAAPPPAGAATVTAMDGTVLPGTLVLNGHTWTADANGQYHTANLSMEWQGYYQTMLAGNGNTLTAWQRLEGNAEAVLESSWNQWTSEAQSQVYREDIQRVIDAEATAAQDAGVNMSGPLSVASVMAIENVLHGTSVSSEELEEMALQGTGQWGTGQVKYNGFDADMMWSLNNWVYYVGGGMDQGQRADGSFLNDVIVGGMMYGTIMQNGVLYELNNSGSVAGTVQDMTTAMNNMMFRQVLVAADISSNSNATGPVVLLPGAPSATAAPLPTVAPAGEVLTADGVLISNTQMIDGHVWTAGADGLFHTTSLAAEWESLYARAQAGDTTLTGAQRLEANAEALFLNTWVGGNNAAQLQEYREDVQRVIDAFAQAETLAGVGANTALTADSLQIVNKTIEDSAVLNEFTMEGLGVAGAASGTRYSGVSTDMFNTDWSTKYVGGGYESGSVAVREFLTEGLLSDIGRPTFVNGNGVASFASIVSWEPLALSQAVTDLNTFMFNHVLTAADFAA